ncbi:MAG TPA: FixH family protein [Burkholderiaceae bacterium]|nr:FixH family protein [Burkholderiaceae bacterium]
MNAMTMNQAESHTTKPWWKEPYVWLIIGGPAIVVVAGIYTAFLAASNPDPLVDKNAVLQARAAAAAEKSQAGVDAGSLAGLQPAHQARNHAASPVLPKSVAADK